MSLNLIALAITALGATRVAAAENDNSSNEQQIAKLIESLGDSNYSTRIQAEFELRGLGVKALDQLSQARHHPNKQIASVAKYLLNSSSTIWFYQDDSFDVRRLLENYGTETPLGRDTILQKLAALEGDEGIGALARIARYEYNGDLSKRAALKLISLTDFYVPADELSRRWTTIDEVASPGTNTASIWLKRYADIYKRSLAQHTERYRQDFSNVTKDLVLPRPIPDRDYQKMPLGLVKLSSYFVRLAATEEELKWWREQVDQEMKLLKAPSEDTSILVIESLCRFGGELSLRCGNKPNAIEIASRLKELAVLIGESSGELDRVHWALDFGMPNIAMELIKIAQEKITKPNENGFVNGQIFVVGGVPLSSSRMLTYSLAEAHFWQGNIAEADKTAKQALDIPDYSTMGAKGFADQLHVRMMDSWASNEYLSALKQDNQYSLILATYYISFLQEIGDFQKAMEQCQKILTRAENDPTYRDSLKELFRDGKGDYGVENFRAMLLFSKGNIEKKKGEYEAAKISLREAYKKNPDQVDALILMREMGGDDAFRKDVESLIDESLERLKIEAKKYEVEWRNSSPEDFARVNHYFANSLNTYAWLMCSVGRDLETALQTSLASMKLEVGSAEYTDTLARCYYVMGDLDSAVYWQERAVTLKPGQVQLMLTLYEYQEAAKKAK